VVETISLALEIRWPDFRLVTVGDGESAAGTVALESPDVTILDLDLPCGFDILRNIRLFSILPS